MDYEKNGMDDKKYYTLKDQFDEEYIELETIRENFLKEK